MSLTLLKYGRPIGDLPVKLLFTTWVKVMETIFQRTTQIPLPSLSLYPLDLTSYEVSGQASPSSRDVLGKDKETGVWAMAIWVSPGATLSLCQPFLTGKTGDTPDILKQLPSSLAEPVRQYTLSFLSSLKLFVNKWIFMSMS